MHYLSDYAIGGGTTKDVCERLGVKGTWTDLSQTPTWEKFVSMLNFTVLKQFAALEAGGRMGILMGDIKSKGMLHSMLFEIAKPGIV